MRVSEVLQDNNMQISKKGIKAFYKAIEDLYPGLEMTGVAWNYDWTYDQCVEILQRTLRYCKLWGFS